MSKIPYNHKAIEKKWRDKWEENPVNVQFDENGKKSGGEYVLDATFGSMMEEEIKRHLSIQEEKLFDFDMDMLHRVKSGDDSVEVKNWVEKSLSSF